MDRFGFIGENTLVLDTQFCICLSSFLWPHGTWDLSSPTGDELTSLVLEMLSLNHVCCCSVAKLRPALCNSMDWSTPGFPVLHYLPEFAQTHVHWVGDAIQPSHPLLPPFSSCLQSFPASGSFPRSRLFASCGQSCGASAGSISPSNEYSGLISFRIDSFDILAIQGSLKGLLQYHN